MSWLSAVTGRAEDLLNKLDKSAADAFHLEESDGSGGSTTTTTKKQLPSGKTPLTSSRPGGKSLSSSSPATNIPSQLPDAARLGPPTSTSTPKPASKSAGASSSKPTSGKKKDADEALFDFLNSKESSEGSKKRVTPISSRHHSRQSSTSSMREKEGEESAGGGDGGSGSGGADVATVQPSATASAETDQQQAVSQRDSPTNSNASADIEELADAMKESPTASEHSVPETEAQEGGETRMSALELENRLLKSEVDSLNQEMASVIERAKKSQSELEKTKQKMAQYTNSASRHDQMLRELQSREMDLQEALNAKDSQLAVMRVQLEEADRKSAAQRKEKESLQTERERILQDQSSASGMHNQALDTMRQKLTEMEGTLHREQQAHKHYQQEASERQSRLEQEQKALADALTNAEKKVSEERAKAAEAYGQLKTVKASLESARQEMVEYKEKASRILQSKERLISSLREESGVVGSADGVSSLEYDSVRQERDMLREEIQRGKLTADNLRMELQDLEVQLQQESSTAQDHIRSLEDSLSEEKHHRVDIEQELLKQKQELQYAIDELHKQKVNYQTRLTDREAEIEKLRNQLTTKSISSTSESELESRVRSLTESLIQKQTMLEALSTEKNSLTLQLERLGQQYRDVENSLMRSAATSVNVGESDEDLRQRLPTFMKEGAADTEVTRRVKRYVHTIDKFSIRLGVFLRRYPIARIFVILYMAMLHLWVMVVLMTYQPEIHGKDYLPSEDKG